MRWMTTIAALTCLWGAAHGQGCPPTASKLSMGKGEYVARPGVVFTLENFVAEMVPKGKTSPQCFIKETHIEHGRVYVSGDSLTRLFRERVQNGGSGGADAKDGSKNPKGKDAKAGSKDDSRKAGSKDDSKKDGTNLSDVTIHTAGNELDLSGKKRGKIPVSFDLIGPVDVADAHTLRLHVDKIKAAGIPAKGLLKLFGFHLSNMMKPGSANGVVVQDDAILVNTEAIANVKGQISHVQVSGDGLVVDFVPDSGQKTQKAEAEKSKAKAAPRHVASAAPIGKK